MRRVMYYQCEGCNRVFENKDFIENCNKCGQEICSACGCLHYVNNLLYCNVCLENNVIYCISGEHSEYEI